MKVHSSFQQKFDYEVISNPVQDVPSEVKQRKDHLWVEEVTSHILVWKDFPVEPIVLKKAYEMVKLFGDVVENTGFL